MKHGKQVNNKLWYMQYNDSLEKYRHDISDM